MKIGIGIKSAATGDIDLNVAIPFLKSERIALQRNADKKGSQPDFHAFIGSDRCGALWKKTSNNGKTFLTGNLESPVFPGGRIDVALFVATDENRKGEYDLTWRPDQARAGNQADAFEGGGGAASSADDGDEIPF